VNNPSNPCGSVYSKCHLEDILSVAEKNYLPILADEIYADMAFPPNEFFAMATLTSDVPILSVGGLAKQFLVPGWRVGWSAIFTLCSPRCSAYIITYSNCRILIHDRKQIFAEIRIALQKLAQVIIGCNSIIQAVLPCILLNTPRTFFSSTNKKLAHHANVVAELLREVPGLTVVQPQGAMYMMVGIGKFRDIPDDVAFTEMLMAEESVMCLPGKCFKFPQFFRLVLCAPEIQLREACSRISDFCMRHAEH
jgi:tyrosine aminotransferase